MEGFQRYEKIKFFSKKHLKIQILNFIKRTSRYLWKNIKKEKLINAEISKGVFKIKQFFPNSKITVVSGSDQNELRWLFKEKELITYLIMVFWQSKIRLKY